VILVYDISSLDSFYSIFRWAQLISSEMGNAPEESPVIMLVGNKSDLDEKGGRKVNIQKAMEYARKSELLFIETSAIKRFQVLEAFEQLFTETYKKFFQNEFMSMTRAIFQSPANVLELGKTTSLISSSSTSSNVTENEGFGINTCCLSGF